MRFSTIIVLLLCCTFNTSCTQTNAPIQPVSTPKQKGTGLHVDTTTTTFHTPDLKSGGFILIISASSETNSTLEFSFYRKKIEHKFIQNGYVITEDSNEADYIAIVAFGLDEGKSQTVNSPIYGMSGGETSYHTGLRSGTNQNLSLYSGTTHTMPSYGVIGTRTKTTERYTRAIALDIVLANEFQKGVTKKVYEARSTSEGSCNSILELFDEMLEAMFINFPGKNGERRRNFIEFFGDCQ